MGNLCSCLSSSDQAQPAKTEQNSQRGTEPAAGTSSSAATPKAGAQPKTPSPKVNSAADIIEQHLASANQELARGLNVDFLNTYKVSKLIGHGAFAKVMICSHKDTKERYAVKTVQKNLEDPQKQRDGGCAAGSCLSSLHLHSV